MIKQKKYRIRPTSTLTEIIEAAQALGMSLKTEPKFITFYWSVPDFASSPFGRFKSKTVFNDEVSEWLNKKLEEKQLLAPEP